MWSLPLLEPPQGNEYPGLQTMGLGVGEVKGAQGQGTWNTVTNAGPVQPLTGESCSRHRNLGLQGRQKLRAAAAEPGSVSLPALGTFLTELQKNCFVLTAFQIPSLRKVARGGKI